MISGTYVPIVIMPHDITGITIVEALILILLLTVITVLFMKFIIKFCIICFKVPFNNSISWVIFFIR